jgi:hypothetical protein
MTGAERHALRLRIDEAARRKVPKRKAGRHKGDPLVTTPGASTWMMVVERARPDVSHVPWVSDDGDRPLSR